MPARTWQSQTSGKIVAVPPSPEESRFDWRLRTSRDDIGVETFLTYELQDKFEHQRRLFLVRATNAGELLASLPSAARQPHVLLGALIRDHAQTGGHLNTAKTLVRSIFDGPLAGSSGLTVAVHRFGAVPVAAVCSIDIDGDEYTVGIYPDDEVRRLAPSASNPDVFLASLDILPGIQFRRYFEDIGEHLHDCIHHCSFVDSFRRIRSVERTYRESIDTKLRVLRKDLSDHSATQLPPDHQSRQRILDRAGYGRDYVTFLLQEYYTFFGIVRRGLHRYPGNTWGRTPTELRKYGAALLADPSTSKYSPEATALHPALVEYLEGATLPAGRCASNLQSMLNTRRTWTDQLVDFTAHLAVQREQQRYSPVVRVFLSLHHDVDVAELVREKLPSHSKAIHQSSVQVDFVREAEPRAHFDYLVHRKIWLSDLVLGVIPEDPISSRTRKSKTFSQIIRELEYANLLNKHVLPCLENPEAGTLDRLRSEVSTTGELIAPGYRLPANQRLLAFDDKVLRTLGSAFRAAGLQSLPNEIARDFDAAIFDLKRRRAVNQVSSMYNLLPFLARLFVKIVNDGPDRIHNEEQLETLLLERATQKDIRTDGLVNWAHDQVMKRVFLIHGKHYPLTTSTRALISPDLARRTRGGDTGAAVIPSQEAIDAIRKRRKRSHGRPLSTKESFPDEASPPPGLRQEQREYTRLFSGNVRTILALLCPAAALGEIEGMYREVTSRYDSVAN